ncbi:hypothetical protein E1269_27140 [Jiangella asiatica]|uniref:Uncharacterized protein n=1 Tax=Jiangella asiatica TaxID=2530372 RepID=A0A4R5CQI8_9ACTN|nr:phosphoribosyltransferase family protein [Jiangella asiatica]TDD99934.1 hypothetical protein E1269_27140 [Jiangella asiatica]
MRPLQHDDVDVLLAKSNPRRLPRHPAATWTTTSSMNHVHATTRSGRPATGVRHRRQLGRLVQDERAELARRVDLYRGLRLVARPEARDLILVDDGLATGVTAEAALRSLRGYRPRRLLLATPVCPPDTARRLPAIADDVVCATALEGMVSIGAYYDDFSQTTDDEVDLLAASPSRSATTGRAADGLPRSPLWRAFRWLSRRQHRRRGSPRRRLENRRTRGRRGVSWRARRPAC